MTDLGERLQIVDEQDRLIGTAPKDEVWQKGLIHRAARIMVRNRAGAVLLQRRGDKPLYPHRWDISVAGHVAEGDSYEATALREAKEEIGTHDFDMYFLGIRYEEATFDAREPVGTIIMRRFAAFYEAYLDELPTRLATGEVDSVAWWPREEVIRLAHEQPDQVTDGLANAVEHYL